MGSIISKLYEDYDRYVEFCIVIKETPVAMLEWNFYKHQDELCKKYNYELKGEKFIKKDGNIWKMASVDHTKLMKQLEINIISGVFKVFEGDNDTPLVSKPYKIKVETEIFPRTNKVLDWELLEGDFNEKEVLELLEAIK